MMEVPREAVNKTSMVTLLHLLILRLTSTKRRLAGKWALIFRGPVQLIMLQPHLVRACTYGALIRRRKKGYVAFYGGK